MMPRKIYVFFKTGSVFLILLVLFSSPCSAQTAGPDKETELFKQATTALQNESYDLALRLYEELIPIRIDKYGEKARLVAMLYSNMGVIKTNLGLYDQAIQYYQKAENILTGLAGDKEMANLAYVQQNLAICYGAKGDLDLAEQYYENAGRLFIKLKIPNLDNYVSYLLNLVSGYTDNNNLKKAEEVLEKAFQYQTIEKLNFKKWNYKGFIYYKKGDYAESIRLFNKSIETGEKEIGPNFRDKELVYMNLGLVFLSMGDFEQSLANYQNALRIIEKEPNMLMGSYSTCLKDIGIIYLRKSEKESNLENFLQLKKRNIETSLDYFQKSLVVITPGFTSSDWFENPEPANAVDKVKFLDALKNKAEALSTLARLNETQDDRENYISQMKLALNTFDLSLKTIQLIRNGFQNQESRLFLTANEHPVYAKALEAACRLYEKTGKRIYFEKAFEFSERSKSADFQSMLRELQAREFSGLPDSLLQKDSDLKMEIAAYEDLIFKARNSDEPDQQKISLWQDKVFSLNKEYTQMIGLIEEQFPRYYQYKYAEPIVSVQQVQRSIDRREAFVEYFIKEGSDDLPGELYTFVITDHEFRIFRKQLDGNFNGNVDHFLQFLKNGKVLNTRKADYVRYASNASYLYKLLLEPITPSLPNYRLVIVPDDKLSYLPFDAFLVTPPDTTKMDFRNLDYMVHHHAISYTYSATLLYYYFQNNLKYSNEVVAFAPDYNPSGRGTGTDREVESFLPLPGAKAEASGVTALLKGVQYVGPEATKEAFIKHAEQYDILHLAMHTILNDTLPLFSKMVFSADSLANRERTLNTAEIYNLKLRSDMVVLSGCNTGSGKLQKGEGVMSLARAFLYAGCPSIIMTLWNVEDASSAIIMLEFYRNIKNGFSKDEALRRAKAKYITEADPMKAHPYYWLGYVSIGKQTPLFKTKARYFVGLIIFVFLAIVLEKWYFKRKKRINRLK